MFVVEFKLPNGGLFVEKFPTKVMAEEYKRQLLKYGFSYKIGLMSDFVNIQEKDISYCCKE